MKKKIVKKPVVKKERTIFRQNSVCPECGYITNSSRRHEVGYNKDGTSLYKCPDDMESFNEDAE